MFLSIYSFPRFETGCGILNGLLAQNIEFARYFSSNFKEDTPVVHDIRIRFQGYTIFSLKQYFRSFSTPFLTQFCKIYFCTQVLDKVEVTLHV